MSCTSPRRLRDKDVAKPMHLRKGEHRSASAGNSAARDLIQFATDFTRFY